MHPENMAFAIERGYHSTEARTTPKVPPTFDEQTNQPKFEHLIDDVLGITKLVPENLGLSRKHLVVSFAKTLKHIESTSIV